MNQKPFHCFNCLFFCRRKVFYTFLALSIFHLSFNISEAYAQTARVYRAGVLIGTFTTLADASAAANTIGDSILLSAHTFKEHDLNMFGGQIWQGTITATDTSTIDAEHLGRIARFNYKSKKNLVLRDVIFTNGEADHYAAFIGGSVLVGDSLKLMGRCIIRNCHATVGRGVGGVICVYDKVKITHNSADSFGGVCTGIYAFDSVEISYNSAPYGGVAASDTILNVPGGGGAVLAFSSGIVIKNNFASKAGGVVIGVFRVFGSQIIGNDAPIAPFAYIRSNSIIKDAYIYNPGPGIKRQAEIVVDNDRQLDLNGAWFGDSDTIGLIVLKTAACKIITGKYAIANWSINRGNAITKSDTAFPLQAAFTYQDGSALPLNSYPWLTGNFTVDKGSFDTPKPKMSPTDTIGSMYRSYAYSFGDTGSKPVNFVCNVDLDTFRATRLIWGKPKLSINDKGREIQVMVYPNPAKEVLNIQGVESGSSIELYDVMGKLMKNEKVKMNNAVLDVKLLPAGVYHLKITTKEGNVGTAKVVKD